MAFYIGNVAALSFLRFLQKTLKRHIGPSSFTEDQRHNTMLETEIQQNGSNNIEVDVSSTKKHELIKCFLRVTNGVIHLFSDSDVVRFLSLDERHTPSMADLPNHPHKDELACLYLMLAIGAQCRGQSDAQLRMAKQYFAKAQQIAFMDMLQDPSLAMIRIFLMMAFYTLSACRRNTAFMYIGIASKAATILGLHIPYQSARASAETRAVRHGTWMSLRVLDLLCSSILARPSSTPSIQDDEYETDDVGNHDAKDVRTLALRANYESSAIIELIVQNCAKSSDLDIKSAETYLQMLREWSQALPEVLRRYPKSQTAILQSSSADTKEVAIGNIHVSCTYYFGVILVTRQFLISRVMSELRDRKSHKHSSKTTPLSEDESQQGTAIQFSKGCINSAASMAQLCHEVSMNNILLDNMCLLKAWLFSAGLVLGFCLLVADETWLETKQAFTHAQETIHKLSRLSPQARQYYEILTSFSDAIDFYRKQLLARAKAASNPYVEQIMTFEESGSGLISAEQSHLPTPGPANPLMEDILYDEGRNLGFDSNMIDGPLMMPIAMPQVNDDIGLQLMWDSYAMQFPNFPALWDDSIQQSLTV